MSLYEKTMILLIGISTLFFGCATQNIPGTASYEEIKTAISTENGNIIVKRDNGFMGSALSSNLFVDNQFVTALRPGNFVQLRIDKGVHFISISSAKALNLGTAFERNLRFEIKDETTRTFRVFPMPTQGMMIEETMN